MTNLKTHFELRYTPILDFNNVYKPIVSPFLKLGQFSIESAGSFEERIGLIFKNEKYQLDIRWDRMIFIAEGPRQDLKKTQGPLFMFFDILSKIRDSPSFGTINNCLLSEINLKEVKGDNFNEIKENFKNKYLSSTATFNLPGFEEDVAVTLQFADQTGKTFKLSYGPFYPEKNYADMKLVPITNTPPPGYKELNGLLLDCLYFETTSDVNMEVFKRMNNFISSNTERISL